MLVLEPAETELWVRFKGGNDPAARDRLFLHYVPWATSIARSVHRRVWAYPVDRDDFVQNATIGLLEAMSRYDPDRGIAFRSYATPRVRGAVFNGLRAILGDRIATRDESRFAARLENLHETDEGSALDGVVDSIVGLGIGYMLDEAIRSMTVVSAADGLAYAQTSETEARLLAAVDRLPERLKAVIKSHYFQHLPFNELAAQWGLTKGRISQLHKAALVRLRDVLHDQ